jgi:hypothetical protein
MRFVNRLLGAVVAVALVVAGALVVIEVLAASFNASAVVVHWRVALRWARQITWDTSVVQSTCVLMAAAGLILVVLELKPRRRRRFTVKSEATDAAFTRRGVKAAVQSAVGEMDGIDATAVSVRRRRIRVRATTTAVAPESAASLEESVRSTAQSQVASLELDPAPRIVTTVGTRGR